MTTSLAEAAMRRAFPAGVSWSPITRDPVIGRYRWLTLTPGTKRHEIVQACRDAGLTVSSNSRPDLLIVSA